MAVRRLQKLLGHVARRPLALSQYIGGEAAAEAVALNVCDSQDVAAGVFAGSPCEDTGAHALY